MAIAPIISVIMPVYNCEMHVQQAIESILNQTVTDFEFLIIDDASTDNTLLLVKEYKDTRIKIIEKPINSGYTNSLNLALNIAQGKYIARMDGDDISFPERFEKQLKFLESNQDIVVCGSYSVIIGTNAIVSVPENYELIKLALLKANCMIHPSVMMQRKVLDTYSLNYDISKEPAEDYDLWIRIAMIGKLHNLQEVLLQYRMHEGQVSYIRNENQKNIAKQTRLDFLSYLQFPKIEKEIGILKKFIANESNIKFNEIILFQEKIKKSILLSNTNNFFQQRGLEDYLDFIEYHTLKAYFLQQKRYKPLFFFNYLKIKPLAILNFTFKDELKLFLKSFIFYQKK